MIEAHLLTTPEDKFITEFIDKDDIIQYSVRATIEERVYYKFKVTEEKFTFLSLKYDHKSLWKS